MEEKNSTLPPLPNDKTSKDKEPQHEKDLAKDEAEGTGAAFGESEITPPPYESEPPEEGRAAAEEEAPDTGYTPPMEVTEYQIVEPPEDEEDGFEKIPAGPTEEIRFDEQMPRRYGRRRRDMERMRAREEPKRPRSLRWVIAVIVVILILLFIAAVLLR